MPRFFLSGSIILLLLRSVAGLQAATVYDNGGPDLQNGYGLTHWIQANDFNLPTGGLISHVQFWDLEVTGGYFQSSVVWEIHANNNGIPGSIVASGTSINLTHVATGRNNGFGYNEFIVNFDIIEASLGAGKYWLVLHNGPLSYTVTRPNTNLDPVFWETTTSSSPIETQEIIAPFTDPWQSNLSQSQMAFNLSGQVGPAITAFAYHSASPQITFTTVAGQHYSVQYKNLLTDSTWLTLSGAGNVTATGSTLQITDLSLGGLKNRFYRAVLLP
jgi:hypothetical protein